MSLRKSINFARSNKFRFNIAKLPILSALTQSIDLGTITLGEIEAYNPIMDMKFHGEKLKFSELDVSYLVDENFDVYTEIYNSVNASVGPYSEESSRFENFTDISIHVYDNDSSKILRKFIFENCFITNIGPISFDVAGSENVLSSVTFSYHSFKIEPNTIDTTGFTNNFNYDIENYPKDVFENS